MRIPKHARKELDAYLDCGLLCRGFARLKCEECGESQLVAFSRKGRGFCPSCLGRRMCATAANLRLIVGLLYVKGLRSRVLYEYHGPAMVLQYCSSGPTPCPS